MGERTPGWCTSRSLVTLPNGAMVVYPYAQHAAPDGAALEGCGVKPDVEVGLTRDAVLHGRDPQLEAAVRCLIGRIQPD